MVDFTTSEAQDYLAFVNQGLITGQSMMHKFGASTTVTSTERDVWNAPTNVDLVFQTVAAQYDIVSADVNDDVAGTGARTITLEGLDADFNELSETINLDGTTLVTTIGSFIRLNRAKIYDVGTYGGTNAGLITIRVTGSGDPQGYITAGKGQTRKAHYTIPAGKTAYMTRSNITMETGKTVTLDMHVRERADVILAPFKPNLAKHDWAGLDTPFENIINANHVFPEKTDVWFQSSVASGAPAIVSVDYDLLIINDLIVANDASFTATTSWQAVQIDGGDVGNATISVFNLGNSNVFLTVQGALPDPSFLGTSFIANGKREADNWLKVTLAGTEKLYCKTFTDSQIIGVHLS